MTESSPGLKTGKSYKEQVIREGQQYLMQNYARLPLVLVRGQGVRVWDAEGRSYLDCVGGIAVNSVGHCHPKVVAAITGQAEELIHCSNLYWFPQSAALAKRLVHLSGLDRAFFCNSGTEANEAAIKLVRKYSYERGKKSTEIISFTNGFHGRTLGSLAATAQPQFWHGFEPLPGGFVHLPFNDIEALRAAITPNTAAIFVEAVQGEGGVNEAAPEFMQALAEIRKKHGVLLVLDEVQCGLGRTGKMFAFEHYGIRPDVITLAKALGGGLPIGALLAGQEVAGVFQPGSHGATFGGNPVACAAALAVLEILEHDHLPANAGHTGSYLKEKLIALKQRFPFIKEVRGSGLLVGMELDHGAPRLSGDGLPGSAGKQLVALCQERGLLVNCTADRVIRFMPPLTITRAEVDEAVAIVKGALHKLAGEHINEVRG
jgi:acetylornithine/N-succinyldiaminopimelate aminotransferase